MKDSKKTRSPLFGRNLFTFFIIIATLILLAGIFVMINYIAVYNSHKITPFIDKVKDVDNTDNNTLFTETEYNINDIKRMKLSDFEEYGVIFKCTSYSEDENRVIFEVQVYKTEESEDIIGTMSANVCVSSNWLGFVAYGSKSTTLRLASDLGTAQQTPSLYKRTFNVTVDADTFPSKVEKTWPVKVTVDKPTFYLYLEWQHYVNGKAVTEAYVLEAPYEEYLPEVGGIR